MHGKISPSMYSGSMVGAGSMAFALMPYCIANARPDEDSTVDLNPQVLAAIFGESKKEVEKAITYLCSPDPLSRSRDCEGRRLVHVGPGPFRYKVVNLQKYRDDLASDERREYWRQHKAWERAGKIGEFKFIPAPIVVPPDPNGVDNQHVSTGPQAVHTTSPQRVHATGTRADAGAGAEACLKRIGEVALQMRPEAARSIDLMIRCETLFGKDEMLKQHRHWLERADNESGKLDRVLAEVELMSKEGRIRTTPAKAAEDIWKRF